MIGWALDPKLSGPKIYIEWGVSLIISHFIIFIFFLFHQVRR